MIFEEFLKDVRKKKKITQGQLADMVFTSHQNISSYERLRTECSFDMGMTLLNALGVSVIIENNQIIIKDGIEAMEKNYIKENLRFINFDVNEFKTNLSKKLKSKKDENINELNKIEVDLKNKGFEIKILDDFDICKWESNHYRYNDELIRISKDGKEITLITSQHSSITYFLLESFIDDIKKEYPQEAKFIEKAILYTTSLSADGYNVYRAFKDKNEDGILEIMPMLENVSDIIIKHLNKKDYFDTISDGFSPIDISISEHLGIYQCRFSRYIHYAFTMPNGVRIICEAPFEGHDILEALSYAEAYFEDYDIHLKEFEEFPSDFEIL